jgi:hypothetical protein
MVRLNLSLKYFFILTLLFISLLSSSQGFMISSPKVEFKDKQMQISYDIINKNQQDLFYVWVEMTKKNGEQIAGTSFSGDVGEKIQTGTNKMIIWEPEKDAIFLNEEIFVEVKAEKYVKSFNKGSVMLLSVVVPGLGQTIIRKGNPWWLTGVAAYGVLAGGIVTNKSYIKSYDSYLIEGDLIKRAAFYNQSQKQMNLSNVLIISGAVLWVADLIWVAATPNHYQPMQHIKLKVDQSTGPNRGTPLLTFQLTF